MRRFILPFVLLIFATPDASASFLIRLDGIGAGTAGTVSYDDGRGHRGSAYGFIGQFDMTFDVGVQNRAFSTFHIDLFHRVSYGQTYLVNVRDLGHPPTLSDWTYGGEMAYLYGKYGATKLSSDVDAAALQLALWKLSLGAAGTLSTSGVSQSVLNRQQAFLSEAGLFPNFLATGRWLDASPSGNYFNRGQSVILDSNGLSPPLENPAPSGLVLAGSGAVFAFIRFVRRIRFGQSDQEMRA